MTMAPQFEWDPSTIANPTDWNAPLGAHKGDRNASETGAWRKSFTISIAMNAFIPKNKGEIVHGMGAVDPLVRDVRWGFEPHQYGSRRRFYMFATDNRSYAGEIGSSRVSLTGQFDAVRIGSIESQGPTFNATPGTSFQLQADVSDSLLGPSYVANTLKRDTSYITKIERVHDYSPTHSGLTIGASGAYPFNPLAPSIDFGLSGSLRVLADGSVALAVVGGHNEFPAYEVIVNDRVVYKDYPTSRGPGLWNLGAASDSFNFRVILRQDGSVADP